MEKSHPILSQVLHQMRFKFDGHDWGANGPKLITNVMKEFCNTDNILQMSPESCQGITVLHPEAFYPIPWREWTKFYIESEEMDLPQSNKTYSFHLWGKHSSHIALESVSNKTLLFRLAQKHCPLTFEFATYK